MSACSATGNRTGGSPRRWRKPAITAWAAVAAVGLLLAVAGVGQAQAHSQRSLPLRRLSHITSSSISILPRHLPSDDRLSSGLKRRDLFPPHPSTLSHDDSLLLHFTLPVADDHDSLGTGEPITMSLRPTEDLIHPHAIVRHHSPPDPITGQTTHTTSPLSRSSIRAYQGYVIRGPSGSDAVRTWYREELSSVVRSDAAALGDERVRGWARVVVHEVESAEHHDGSPEPSWEGAFSLDGELWSVRTAQSYGWVKGSEDPAAEWRKAHRHGGLVAWRDGDVARPSELGKQHEGGGRGRSGVSCSHDQLAFNAGMSHSVYKAARESHRLKTTFPTASPFDSAFEPSTSYFDTLFGMPSFRPRGYPPPPALTRRQVTGSDINGNVTSNFVDSIGSTTGCPVSAKVVFIGVAADCTYTSRYGSADAARTQILTNLNSASALYSSTFNVRLGVVELNVMDATCPSSASASEPWNVGCPEGGPSGLDLNTRLSVFSQWRGNKGGGDGAGLWHLMTNCSTGSEVGVAWLGQLCKVDAVGSGSQVTSGTGVSSATSTEWQVTAHEIGHNFGAIHDCAAGCSMSGACCPLTASTCNANAAYIMSPVSSRNVSAFSPCSIGNICTLLGSSLNTTCLADPGQRSVISLRQCGNGIVEPGEDCDPGGNSTSSCCNPTTCKFASGALCDPTSSSCCTASCQFAPSTQVCRAAVNSQCDIAEMCTGTNSTCPPDRTVDDGSSCGASGAGLTCAAGLCTSRDAQCQQQGTAMGITRACSADIGNSCSLTCADPTSRSDCIVLSGSFVDGTSCGLGGRCKSGTCDTGSVLDQAKSWYLKNLQIAIPVTVAAGIIALLMLAALFNCCRRGRRPQSSGRYVTQSVAPRSQGGGFGGLRWTRGTSALRRNQQQRDGQPVSFSQQHPPPPPPPAARLSGGNRGRSVRGSGGTGSNWVDPTLYNGPDYNHPR